MPDDEPLAHVTPIPLAPRAMANYACRRCGSEWFDSAIVLDAHDVEPVGYSLSHTKCRECGLPLPVMP